MQGAQVQPLFRELRSHTLYSVVKKKQKVIPSNAGEDAEPESLRHCWWEHEMVQALWKILQHFLIRLNTGLRYDPAVALMGPDPQRKKNYVHINTVTF